MYSELFLSFIDPLASLGACPWLWAILVGLEFYCPFGSSVVCLNGCAWLRMPHLVSILQLWTTSFAFMNIAPSSASAGKDITDYIIVVVIKIVPLLGGGCFVITIVAPICLSFLLSTGTWSLVMKIMVFVPLMPPPTPSANLPNLFATEWDHVALCFGLRMSWWYVIHSLMSLLWINCAHCNQSDLHNCIWCRCGIHAWLVFKFWINV